MRTICLLYLLAATAAFGQDNPNQQDIVQRLMPNGTPAVLHLPTPVDKPRVIGLLRVKQVRATGKQAQQVAYLLAILGSEYPTNRGTLVNDLRRCTAKPVRECDGDTAAFVIDLFQRGDETLLRPLFDAGLAGDNPASKVLGNFYVDLITKNPGKYLDGLRTYPPLLQRDICAMAGKGDGSGLTPAQLQTVRTRLSGIGSPPARACLTAVEGAAAQRSKAH